MIHIALEIGIILLLVYLPLAAGGVTDVSLVLLEFVCAGCFILWLAGGLGISQPAMRHQRKKRKGSQAIRRSLQAFWRKKLYEVHITFVPGVLVFGVFLLLVGIQLLPVPAVLVKFISPLTFQLYADAATQTGNSIPTWMPFSIATQATETEFYKLIAYGLLFLVVVSSVRTVSHIKRLVYIIIAMGGIEAFYGFSQISQSRISGSFVNHNHFAGYLEMVIPLAFGLLLAQLETRRLATGRLLLRLVDEKYLKILLLAGFWVILTSALLLSGSRSGLVSLSLSMAVMCGLIFLRKLFRKWVWVVVGLMGLMLGLGLLTQPEEVLSRIGALAKPTTDLALLHRLDVWRDSMRLFMDAPVVGTGFGTFSHIFRRYQTFASGVVFTHAENDYVQLLTETGLVGCSLMLWAVGSYSFSTFRAWRNQRSRWAAAIGAGGFGALFSMAVHSGSDFNLHIPSNAVLFTVIAGLTYAVAHLQFPNSQAGPESEKQTERVVVSPHERHFRGHPAIMWSGIAGVVIFVAAYLIMVGKTYTAGVANRQFRESLALRPHGYTRNEDIEVTTQRVRQAIQADPNHGDYYFTQGNYLWYHYVVRYGAEEGRIRDAGLDTAVRLLQQALRKDPANPWYAYELWRVSMFRGVCHNDWEQCATTRYLRMAFKNGPYELLIRSQLAAWSHAYTPKEARLLVREIIVSAPQFTQDLLRGLWYQIRDLSTLRTFLPENTDALYALSWFLFEKHEDYASDLVAAEACAINESTRESEAKCQADPVIADPASLCASSSPQLRFSDNESVELGSDDRGAEWRVYVSSETFRVRKTVCLPADTTKYTAAAVKIYMNNGGSADFLATVWVDDVMIAQYDRTLPSQTQWHEIPFDISLLHGKEFINVYVRVRDATASGNYLIIWGDDSSPATYSLFNFATVDDLSYDPDVQQGEYMIRLLLK